MYSDEIPNDFLLKKFATSLQNIAIVSVTNDYK